MATPISASSKKNSDHKRKLAFLFFLGLFLRIGYILAVPPRPMDWDDSTQWNKTAMRFFHHEGFLQNAQDLDPKRAPVYPLFMAAVYSVFGPENFAAVKHAQAAVSAASGIVLYGIVSAVAAPQWALAAALAWAIYPPSIVYSEILQSETLFILIFLSFLWLWIRGAQSGRVEFYLGAGVLLGAANLCRGTLMLLPFLIWPVELLYKEGRQRLPKSVAMGLVSILVIAPWSWRNHQIYGGFLPIASGGSEMFWFGTLPWAEQRLFGAAPSFQGFAEIKNPVDLERTFSRQAIETIAADPKTYAQLCVHKFFFFWFQPIGERLIARRAQALAWVLRIAHIALIGLAFFGILKTLKEWRKFLPFYLVISYFTALHTILAPEPRYRLPIEPLLLMFALAAFSYFRRSDLQS